MAIVITKTHRSKEGQIDHIFPVEYASVHVRSAPGGATTLAVWSGTMTQYLPSLSPAEAELLGELLKASAEDCRQMIAAKQKAA